MERNSRSFFSPTARIVEESEESILVSELGRLAISKLIDDALAIAVWWESGHLSLISMERKYDRRPKKQRKRSRRASGGKVEGEMALLLKPKCHYKFHLVFCLKYIYIFFFYFVFFSFFSFGKWRHRSSGQREARETRRWKIFINSNRLPRMIHSLIIEWRLCNVLN